MNDEFEKLDDLLNKMNKTKKSITKRMTNLKEDKNVKKYLKLEEDLEEINSNYDKVLYQHTLKKCECCDHLFVVSEVEEDYCEGRTYYEYGCLKCGIDTHLYELSDIERFKPYIEYMRNSHIMPKNNTGLYFNSFNDFLDAQKFYLDNKDKYDDKEIIRLLKKNNRQNKKRKDK